MLFITDNLSTSNVSLESICNIRYEEITETIVSKMCKSTRPACSFSNEWAARHMSRLLDTKFMYSGNGDCFVMSQNDVAIVTQYRPVAKANSGKHEVGKGVRRYFKVTCRRDYEVFGFGEEFVILDRDGATSSNIVNMDVHTCEALEALYVQCNEMNL